jgi:hypothetical protein
VARYSEQHGDNGVANSQPGSAPGDDDLSSAQVLNAHPLEQLYLDLPESLRQRLVDGGGGGGGNSGGSGDGGDRALGGEGPGGTRGGASEGIEKGNAKKKRKTAVDAMATSGAARRKSATPRRIAKAAQDPIAEAALEGSTVPANATSTGVPASKGTAAPGNSIPTDLSGGGGRGGGGGKSRKKRRAR